MRSVVIDIPLLLPRRKVYTILRGCEWTVEVDGEVASGSRATPAVDGGPNRAGGTHLHPWVVGSTGAGVGDGPRRVQRGDGVVRVRPKDRSEWRRSGILVPSGFFPEGSGLRSLPGRPG